MSTALVQTEERERRRISTAIHDGIGQTLAATKIKLGAMASSPMYVGPFLISGTATIHYIAVDSAGNASTDAVVTYAFRDGIGLWAWGSNGSGQLGDGTVDPSLPGGMTPVQVTGTTGLTGVRAVAGGTDWSVAVKGDGTVWAWGNNASGQLGNGTTDDSSTPTQVSTGSGLGNVISVAAGGGHTLALDANGDVWAWGWNGNGQLGDGTTAVQRLSPVRVTGLSGVIGVAQRLGIEIVELVPQVGGT